MQEWMVPVIVSVIGGVVSVALLCATAIVKMYAAPAAKESTPPAGIPASELLHEGRLVRVETNLVNLCDKTDEVMDALKEHAEKDERSFASMASSQRSITESTTGMWHLLTKVAQKVGVDGEKA